MSRLLSPRAFLAVVALFAAVRLGSAQAPRGKADAGGFPAPTPELERGRAVYVLSSCHFCHGVDLTGAQMGATDLMHSPLIETLCSRRFARLIHLLPFRQLHKRKPTKRSSWRLRTTFAPSPLIYGPSLSR